MDGENISAFFQPPLAEIAVIGGTSIYGHYEQDPLMLFGGNYAGELPVFMCPAIQVASTASGTTVTLRGKTYKVKGHISKPGDGAIAYVPLEEQ